MKATPRSLLAAATFGGVIAALHAQTTPTPAPAAATDSGAPAPLPPRPALLVEARHKRWGASRPFPQRLPLSFSLVPVTRRRVSPKWLPT